MQALFERQVRLDEEGQGRLARTCERAMPELDEEGRWTASEASLFLGFHGA